MRESKKRRNIWQAVSLAILVLLLGLFVYLNFNQTDQVSEIQVKIEKMSVIENISPLEWDKPKAPASVIKSVYYGHPEDLNKKVILSADGKSYKEIQVIENNEEFVHFDTIKGPRIKHVTEFDPEGKSRQGRNPEGKYMRKSVADAIVKMLEHLPSNMGIMYGDGYISPEHYNQMLLMRFAMESMSNPNPKDAYHKALAKVPPSGMTGGAVTLVLFDVTTNTIVDTDNTDEMHLNKRNATFALDTTPEQRKNRLILLEAATKAGFANYGHMWWYFVHGEKMHAYVNNLDTCKYGLMQFDTTNNKFTPYKPLSQSMEEMLQELQTKAKSVMLPMFDKAKETAESIKETYKAAEAQVTQVGAAINKVEDRVKEIKDEVMEKLTPNQPA